MSTESDRLLIQRIRSAGAKTATSNDAWSELYRRYHGRLTAYVRRRLKDHASVDDVVQNTFVGFLNSLPNYDDKRDLQTWLFTIASHKVTDLLRKNGRRPTATGNDEEDELIEKSPDDRQRPASSLARSAERREEEETALGEALRRLVRDWKSQGDYQNLMVLELLLVKGWGNKDVANHLRISEQQIANIKFQTKKKLHEFMRNADLSADVFPELKSE